MAKPSERDLRPRGPGDACPQGAAEPGVGRAHSLLAAHRLQCPQPGADQDEPEAERVGKYMIRPVLALERLTFLEPEGKVGYRWGRDGAGQET